VPGLAHVRALSAGGVHTCATLDDGTLTCWGSDMHGQLGDHATSLAARGAPGAAADFGAVAPNRVSAGLQIASGYFHNCVLGADGRTNCWGGPTVEDLGTGASTAPLDFAPLTATVLPVCTASGCAGAISVCGGYESTCSLLSDGTVWCWGLDVDGELGNGTATSTSIAQPVQAALAGPAVQLSCGLASACALLANGTVQCWGNNANGELGNGTSGGIDATPGTVLSAAGTPLDGVTAVAASPTGAHACALRGGAVYCWGYALYGEIGRNYDPAMYPNQGYAVPVGLSNGKTAKTIALGSGHSCVVTADGTAQCWGDDFNGAVGDNNPDPNGHPIVFPPATPNLTWLTGIAAGNDTTCAVRVDGSVWCWGDNASYGGGAVGTGDLEDIRAPVQVVTASGAPLAGGAVVTAGFYDACTLRPDGTAACWGYDGWRELGNGDQGLLPGNSYPYAVSVLSSTPVTR
jgi:alpha-tubulin suppressor-like RCC1 family protein